MNWNERHLKTMRNVPKRRAQMEVTMSMDRERKGQRKWSE